MRDSFMEKTRTKFKIVSDPFAPEEKWLPACHSTDEGSAAIACDIWSSEDRSKPSDRLKRFAGLLVLSVTLAVSGGIIAGQSIHTMYYAYHVVCISAGQWGFEPWGSFYHWYNQAPALNCYMPVLFSYFAAYILTFHGSGKTSLWVWLTVMGCYYLWLWFHPQDTFS